MRWPSPCRARIALAATLAAALAASAAAAPARDPEAELAKLVDGRRAGDPVACVQARALAGTRVIPGIGIVYRAGNMLYVNRTSDGAARIGPDDVLVTSTTSAQLCRLDVVQFVDRNTGIWTGFTTLGDFIPYRRPK